MLGRPETQTRDVIYCQTIRTVRDISRDDRARIATCSLRTPTDRQTKTNYSIDTSKEPVCPRVELTSSTLNPDISGLETGVYVDR